LGFGARGRWFLEPNSGKNNEQEGNSTVDVAERNIGDYWMVLSV
jgi:hypothetical protein